MIIFIKKNLIIKLSYLVLFIFLGCSNNNESIILINKSTQPEIDFPEKMEILFNGFKVGEATLNNKQGQYSANFDDEIQLTTLSEFTMVKDNVIGSSIYYFDISDVVKTKKKEASESIDTAYYFIEENNMFIEEDILNILKEFVDTLIAHKDSIWE